MNIKSHKLESVAVILAAAACLAGCSSKPREKSALQSGGAGLYGNQDAVSGADSTYPYGTEGGRNPGIGGTGTMLLDTSYHRDSFGNRSDSARTQTDGNPGTLLPGTQGKGGSGMDSLRGPDSMKRDRSMGLPDTFPGTGTPNSRPEGGTGEGGKRDSTDPDKVNDSLGVLDWHERG